MLVITAAADGSSLSNPGPAGWAWYIDDVTWAAGGWPLGTNNMGELMAVLDLLRQTAVVADEPISLLCDSQYVINSLTKWMPSWKRRGWRKGDGKPVLNKELFIALDEAMAGRDVRFTWVKGHAGHRMNEAADVRARAAATAYQQGTPVPSGPGFPGANIASASLDVTPSTPEVIPDLFSGAGDGDGEPATPPGEARGPVERGSAARVSPSATSGRRAVRPWRTTEADAPTGTPADGPGGRDREVERVVESQREVIARRSPTRLRELLHDDYVEYSPDGHIFTRARLLALPAEARDETQFELLGATRLGDVVVLVRWRGRSGSRASLYSSVWTRADGRWQARFSQGTPTP
jgi:ribonuclease HI